MSSTVSNLFCIPKPQTRPHIGIQLNGSGVKSIYTTGDAIEGVTIITIPSGTRLDNIKISLEGTDIM